MTQASPDPLATSGLVVVDKPAGMTSHDVIGRLRCIFHTYFEIPFRGRFADLFAIIAIFSACNVGIGLVISTVCKTSLQSVVSSFLFLLPCIMISGLITPADAMPRWFYYIAHLDPMYYANNCMWRIYLEGAGLGELWHLIVKWSSFFRRNPVEHELTHNIRNQDRRAHV